MKACGDRANTQGVSKYQELFGGYEMSNKESKVLEEAFQWLREAKVFIKQNSKSPSDLLLLEAIESFTTREDKNYNNVCPFCGKSEQDCNFSYPHPLKD